VFRLLNSAGAHRCFKQPWHLWAARACRVGPISGRRLNSNVLAPHSSDKQLQLFFHSPVYTHSLNFTLLRLRLYGLIFLRLSFPHSDGISKQPSALAVGEADRLSAQYRFSQAHNLSFSVEITALFLHYCLSKFAHILQESKHLWTIQFFLLMWMSKLFSRIWRSNVLLRPEKVLIFRMHIRHYQILLCLCDLCNGSSNWPYCL
jgi:hypothetical protein